MLTFMVVHTIKKVDHNLGLAFMLSILVER